MDTPIVRTFDDLDTSERARGALLAAGFDRDSITCDVLEDEAGPEQANFTVGDSRRATGGSSYNDTYRPKQPRRPHVLLTVLAADDGQARLGTTILEANGGRSPGPAAPGGND